MASISRNQEDDPYEDMNIHQFLPGGSAHTTLSQSVPGSAVPPPLPQRASRYAVEGNPSYLTKRQEETSTSESIQMMRVCSPRDPSSPSPPPSYNYVSTIIKTKFQNVTKSLPSEKSLSVSSSGSTEDVTDDLVKSLPITTASYLELRQDAKQMDSSKINAIRPSGFNILNLFWRGNVIFLVPINSERLLPLTISGKTVRGGGSYNDDSKFEVIVPREHSTENVIALRNIKHKERFLCINSKGKIKARNGYKDSCDFFVTVKGGKPSPTVYFESARSDGFYLGVRANNTVVDSASDITPDAEEAQFTVIADRIQDSVPASKLKVFEKDSIMNQICDRSVIRLFSHRRYLAIDIKGRVMQTHNADNQDCWFMLFDRGLGVVSLRSYNYAGYWLKIQESQTLGKGMLGPEALFVVKETQDHLLCFESVLQPGIFVSPPLKKSSVTFSQPQFTIEVLLNQ